MHFPLTLNTAGTTSDLPSPIAIFMPESNCTLYRNVTSKLRTWGLPKVQTCPSWCIEDGLFNHALLQHSFLWQSLIHLHNQLGETPASHTVSSTLIGNQDTASICLMSRNWARAQGKNLVCPQLWDNCHGMSSLQSHGPGQLTNPRNLYRVLGEVSVASSLVWCNPIPSSQHGE